jgi:hypothetical protein
MVAALALTDSMMVVVVRAKRWGSRSLQHVYHHLQCSLCSLASRPPFNSFYHVLNIMEAIERRSFTQATNPSYRMTIFSNQPEMIYVLDEEGDDEYIDELDQYAIMPPQASH